MKECFTSSAIFKRRQIGIDGNGLFDRRHLESGKSAKHAFCRVLHFLLCAFASFGVLLSLVLLFNVGPSSWCSYLMLVPFWCSWLMLVLAFCHYYIAYSISLLIVGMYNFLLPLGAVMALPNDIANSTPLPEGADLATTEVATTSPPEIATTRTYIHQI